MSETVHLMILFSTKFILRANVFSKGRVTDFTDGQNISLPFKNWQFVTAQAHLDEIKRAKKKVVYWWVSSTVITS